MTLFSNRIPSATLTIRVLAHLLRYPDAELRTHFHAFGEAIAQESALSCTRQAELLRLLDMLSKAPSVQVESEFVELFDRGRSTSLHLFEHVHGDSRERGPAMIDLIQTYEKAGLLIGPQELPDHLAVVLEFASTQPAEQAREFLAETSHLVRQIFSALLKRGSPYACVLGAVLELAGEKAEPVQVPDEPQIDESWTEPEVFGGCSTAGQARPGQEQPIRIMKRAAAQQGVSV